MARYALMARHTARHHLFAEAALSSGAEGPRKTRSGTHERIAGRFPRMPGVGCQ